MKCLRPNFEQCGGLIPVVMEDPSREIVGVATVNELAWLLTLQTGFPYCWSAANGGLWRCEIAGSVQRVQHVQVNHDGNALRYILLPDEADTGFALRPHPSIWRDVKVWDRDVDKLLTERLPLALIEVTVCEELQHGWYRRDEY